MKEADRRVTAARSSFLFRRFVDRVRPVLDDVNEAGMRSYDQRMKERNPKPPSWVPYRWYWVIGTAVLLVGLLSAIQGPGLHTATTAFAGVMIVIVGFVERHRGAPPI
jgi:hypothetical protein